MKDDRYRLDVVAKNNVPLQATCAASTPSARPIGSPVLIFARVDLPPGAVPVLANIDFRSSLEQWLIEHLPTMVAPVPQPDESKQAVQSRCAQIRLKRVSQFMQCLLAMRSKERPRPTRKAAHIAADLAAWIEQTRTCS